MIYLSMLSLYISFSSGECRSRNISHFEKENPRMYETRSILLPSKAYSSFWWVIRQSACFDVVEMATLPQMTHEMSHNTWILMLVYEV